MIFQRSIRLSSVIKESLRHLPRTELFPSSAVTAKGTVTANTALTILSNLRAKNRWEIAKSIIGSIGGSRKGKNLRELMVVVEADRWKTPPFLDNDSVYFKGQLQRLLWLLSATPLRKSLPKVNSLNVSLILLAFNDIFLLIFQPLSVVKFLTIFNAIIFYPFRISLKIFSSLYGSLKMSQYDNFNWLPLRMILRYWSGKREGSEKKREVKKRGLLIYVVILQCSRCSGELILCCFAFFVYDTVELRDW